MSSTCVCQLIQCTKKFHFSLEVKIYLFQPHYEIMFLTTYAENSRLDRDDSDQSARMRTLICLHWAHITKTRQYSFDPLKAHFYTIKLGFTRVYINFLISAQLLDCGYSLEPPQRGGSNKYP